MRKISLAWRSSQFSRSRAFIFSATSLGRPARLPLSTSLFLTQSCSVAGEQPILAAIDEMAAQRDGCSASWSSTIRMARLRPSGENLFVVLLTMAPLSQKLEPPANPVRFTSRQEGRTRSGWLSLLLYGRLKGWLYVAAVIDLFSRRVVGWSMNANKPASSFSGSWPTTVSPFDEPVRQCLGQRRDGELFLIPQNRKDCSHARSTERGTMQRRNCSTTSCASTIQSIAIRHGLSQPNEI